MARSRRTPPEIPDLSAQAWLNARGPIHRALKYLVQHLFESLPAPHEETHLVGGSDALQTPGNPVTLDPNLGAVVGAGPSYAREDHRHALDLKLTAKGDLLTRTAAAYTRLPVGLDSFVLTADSTKPEGLSWKAGAPANDGAGVGSLAWPGGTDDGSGESWFPGPPGPQGPVGPPGSGGSGGGGMSPPGIDGEDAEYPWVIPGGAGPAGAAGATGPAGSPGSSGVPGLDADDPEYPYVIPGPQGPTGVAGPGGVAKESHIAFLALSTEVAFS
jgi:hypothetical protein